MDFYVESDTRLFIGGMGPSIKEADLRKHFVQFGVLQECSLKADLSSGKSKGYAFISYEDSTSIDRVLAAAPHKLHDRILDVKRAKEIAEIAEPAPDSSSCLKIFVGALPETCTSYRLKEYFSKYGCVDAAIIITNHETGLSRGFGFVTFRNLHSVRLVLEDYHDHQLDGKWIETKCCLPRCNQPENPSSGGHGYAASYVAQQHAAAAHQHAAHAAQQQHAVMHKYMENHAHHAALSRSVSDTTSNVADMMYGAHQHAGAATGSGMVAGAGMAAPAAGGRFHHVPHLLSTPEHIRGYNNAGTQSIKKRGGQMGSYANMWQ